MSRRVYETLSGWSVFRGPPIPSCYDGSFPSKEVAERVALDRDNEEFWDALKYLATKMGRAARHRR